MDLVSPLQWSLFAIFSVTVVVVCFIVFRSDLRWRRCVKALLVIYIDFVLLTTLIARNSVSQKVINFIPLWSWYEVIINHSYSMFLEICRNLGMLIPFGSMLYILFKVTVKQSALFGFFLSACIEVLQLVSSRGLFEWDDILHNVIGCAFGCFISKRIWIGIRKR